MVPDSQDGKAGSPAVAASTLGLLVDLLCFCVQHHQYRVKYYILRSDTVGKVLRLLRRREKWLVVAALRFLRTCIGLKVRSGQGSPHCMPALRCNAS